MESNDVKVSLTWVTGIVVVLIALCFMVTDCSKKNAIQERAFAEACIKAGKQYIESNSDSIGKCI